MEPNIPPKTSVKGELMEEGAHPLDCENSHNDLSALQQDSNSQTININNYK